MSPIYLNTYDAWNYNILNVGDISWACIHLKQHQHALGEGHCRESTKVISRLMTDINSMIAMAASKEFLDTFFIHNRVC